MTFDFIDKFSTHLRSVLVRAFTFAHELHEAEITTEHLLWALATQKGSIGAEMLSKAKIDPERVRLALLNRINERTLAKELPPNLPTEQPTLSDAVKRTIERAVTTAATHTHRYIGTEHLLTALLAVGDQGFMGVLTREHIDVKTLRSHMNVVMRGTSKFPELAEGLEGDPSLAVTTTTKEKESKVKRTHKTPALDYFTIDLTSPDRVKTIDPVIGREREIERVIQILARRNKNNPVLLGEPGVGKTAIVEGLGKRVAGGDVPEVLWGKRILQLDLAMVVAGTIYRGEFEGRIKQILDEVTHHPEIILFIDEVHTVIGAGGAGGSMDAANLLKPALARGAVRVIGATTPAEYKKYIEGDAALERRFQPVQVTEPTAAETREILLGVRKGYEDFHGVTFAPGALDEAVTLAERYLPERRFPDKAIDILDEAAAHVRLQEGVTSAGKKLSSLERKLMDLREVKARAVEAEDFDRAIAVKDEEYRVQTEIADLRRGQEKSKTASRTKIQGKDIIRVVSRMVGIPLEELGSDEEKKLLNLEDELAARIVGQDTAVHAVASALRRAKTGLGDPKRPLASFLFLGPTGVGKTELAKVLSETIFHRSDALIRLDMSEFGESFTVSKLLGAPAGYVGYKETTKLTDMVKHHPYSVVLFDEIEKAHPDVVNVLLQILEDGHLTDAVGRKINFKNTIVILTSNLGGEQAVRGSMGFGHDTGGDTKHAVLGAARSHFKPELLNRLDEIVIFEKLEPQHLEKIVTLAVGELGERLQGNPAIMLTEPAKKLIAEKAFDERSGAREVRRVIQELVERPLAQAKLTGTFGKNATVEIKTVKKGIVLRKR